MAAPRGIGALARLAPLARMLGLATRPAVVATIHRIVAYKWGGPPFDSPCCNAL